MTFTNSFISTKVVALAVIATLAFIPLVSLAKSGNNGKVNGSAREVHIAEDGTVLVRGATISSISGNTIVASVTWGNSGLSWTVRTDGSTEFVRSSGGTNRVGDLATGHVISFAGILDASSTPFTVNAKVVKDWSLPQQVTLNGKVKSVNSGSQNFVIESKKDSDVTVTIASSTVIQLKNGGAATFAEITVNDEVKATGLYNSGAKTLAAQKIVVENDNDDDDDDNRHWKKLLNFHWNGWLKFNNK